MRLVEYDIHLIPNYSNLIYNHYEEIQYIKLEPFSITYSLWSQTGHRLYNSWMLN